MSVVMESFYEIHIDESCDLPMTFFCTQDVCGDGKSFYEISIDDVQFNSHHEISNFQA
jgi:hypothetical protein